MTQDWPVDAAGDGEGRLLGLLESGFLGWLSLGWWNSQLAKGRSLKRKQLKIFVFHSVFNSFVTISTGFFEAYTMGIAELRRSVESPAGVTNRSVPLLERNDRQRNQSVRLSGIETEARPYQQAGARHPCEASCQHKAST